jgi:hypothetical protein
MRLNNKPNQIVTVGASEVQSANTTLSSKHSYTCANAQITRGFTNPPISITECLDKFPNIKVIADAMGVCGGNYWYGPNVEGFCAAISPFYDLLTGITSDECNEITGGTFPPFYSDKDGEVMLGTAWLGCLWGSPMASFSCTCPDIGERFADYLKLRLNVATFWKTPIEVPAQRQEFLDSVQYGERVTISIAGDLSITPGDIVRLKVDNMASMSGPSTSQPGQSVLTRDYYVLSVKNNILNSGSHTTTLEICNIRKNAEV